VYRNYVEHCLLLEYVTFQGLNFLTPFFLCTKILFGLYWQFVSILWMYIGCHLYCSQNVPFLRKNHTVLLVWFAIWIHLITKMYTLMYLCIYDIMRQSLPDTITVFRCVVYCRFCSILLYCFNLCCFKAIRNIKFWCKFAICNLWNSPSQFLHFCHRPFSDFEVGNLLTLESRM
jgi:hypothetical protein